jgi:hypothetical protein
VPDFDLDFGLAPNVELGLDGAWAIEGTPDREYALDHRAPDNLWLSSKVGLFDTRDDDGSGGHSARVGWAGGLQLGPRLPVAPDVRGIGFQALALLGRVTGRVRLVGNAGFLIDPGETPSRSRPTAALLGADASIDLDDGGIFSVDADLSYVAFLSSEKNQLTTTVGLVWAATPWLDLSANALLGFLAGGDRYGAYLGVSPKVPIFK